MYTYVYIYIYICKYTSLNYIISCCTMLYHIPPSYQKCTSKGIRRRGIALKHRSSLRKEPTPCRPTPLLAQL